MLSKKVINELGITEFDAAQYLNTPETVAEYLLAAFESRDTELIKDALGTVARSAGMSKVADDAGLNRESLYKVFKPGTKPAFETVLKILDVLQVDLIPRARCSGSDYIDIPAFHIPPEA